MTNATATELLEEIVEGCLEAVSEEIEAVREDLERRGLADPLAASGGRLQDTAGPGFVYAWTLPDGKLDIRPDDAVRVRCEFGETRGFVGSFDARSRRLELLVSDWLERHPGPAELEFDPTWLLASLAGRLERLRDEPGEFHPETALRLFGRSYPGLDRREPALATSGELNSSQRDALSRLLGSDVHFVWGPPGTGKTRLLGHAVAELAREGRVLVTSVTNGAVDEAARRVAEVMGEEAARENRIVRAGAAFSATGDERLSLDAAVQRRVMRGGSRVASRLVELEDRLLRPGERPDPGLHVWKRHARLVAAARRAEDREALDDLGRVASELQLQGVIALREAEVVLSTFARLTIWEELGALRFDSLVIDEASTAPLPYALMAAAQARRRAAAIGDFQQLPAVVVSRGEAAARWLSRDAFREAGVIRDTVEDEVPLPDAHDQLCAMLVTQYRMAPAIRGLVSELFYGGRLEDAPDVRERPGPPSPLVLLDTTAGQPAVERLEGSRANSVHAETVVQLLEVAARLGIDDVAVVAPYRLQIRRIRELARTRLGRRAPRDLEISTVHGFQGREKSLVVFDTVDAPPGRSWFLHEGRNRSFPRLLNVALSRARDMLVVVGTAEGLRQTLPEEALLNRVLARIRAEGTVLGVDRMGQAPGLFRA